MAGPTHASLGDGSVEAPWPVDLPRPVESTLLSGGWVGTTWRATLADRRRVVVKQTPYPADGEVDGLAALAAAGVPTPQVLGHAGGTLVLEEVSGPPDWAATGRAIAGMHRVTGERFGWHRDNRAGRFVQPNGWLSSWPEFFVERRVRPHLADPSVPAELRLRLERACDGPIQALLPAGAVPVLTHGDLWRGNVVDGRWVIDPEVSLADRELDLAYMQMSARDPLPAAFWDAYTAELPLPEGYDTRRELLELHHRLLQVRHFGASQLAPLDRVLTGYGW
ncbi:MAG TPA: fructosamine kinase family protein [Actinotalea sp.]|nr:fructosamine kinase family protein [Actinotalea sp.]